MTVSQLTTAIKSELETTFPLVHVQGEITNFKPHSNGHYYFDLKDAEAKIPAVFFRAKQAPLSRPPKEGDQVVVTGALTVYPPHGRYQLIVKEFQFAGVGALLLKFEELKKKLHTRGWFDPKHKKPLPTFPRCIGVVTSPTGAVIHDIIHVLRRRSPGFHLILNPVSVQGEHAAAQIAQAIVDFNRYQLADVLIVGRGGGSLEDLWPFNEECVAQAIFESKIPIISAVGHETDVTLADFVADVRAPTPSAAAEIVLAHKTHYLQHLHTTALQLRHCIEQLIDKRKREVLAIKRHPLIATPLSLLHPSLQHLDYLKGGIDQRFGQHLTMKRLALEEKQRSLKWLNPRAQLRHRCEKLVHLSKQLSAGTHMRLQLNRQRLKQLVQELKALDPKNVLKRGYAILFDEKAHLVIASVKHLTPQTVVKAMLADGEIHMKVQ